MSTEDTRVTEGDDYHHLLYGGNIFPPKVVAYFLPYDVLLVQLFLRFEKGEVLEIVIFT